MRRTQSLKLSVANYSKTSAFCGRHSAKIRKSQLATSAFFHGKGKPVLYPILPPRGEISRGYRNSWFFKEFSLKTAVGGEFFLTQRRREAENAEKIANL